MTDRNETVADIVDEMRRIYPPRPLCEQTVDGQFVHDEMHWLADRIEAAAKLDIEMNRKCAFDTANDFRDIQCRDCVHNPSSDNYEGRVGNVAKLREALERELKIHIGHNEPLDAQRIRAALSAPPRNCDVGTAEEQKARLADWCHRTHCGDCPFCERWCALSWANAPYDAAQEGGK